jgi:hypothetical protein
LQTIFARVRTTCIERAAPSAYQTLVTRRSKRLLATGVFALLVAISAFFYLLWPRYPDPVYDGIALSEHLYRQYSKPIFSLLARPMTAQARVEQQKEFRFRELSYKALQKAGPEALPLLTNWLATAPSPWRTNLHARLRASGYDFPRITADRRSIALTFLTRSPFDPKIDLTPILVPMLINLNEPDLLMAAQLISRTTQRVNNIDVTVALRALLPVSYRYEAVEAKQLGFSSYNKFQIDLAVGKLDPDRLYRPLVVLELGPIPNRVGAARELAENPRLADRAILLLIANLTSTNRSVQEHCALALAAYGTQANLALPALSNLLTSSRERVRLAGSNAIASIKAAKPAN